MDGKSVAIALVIGVLVIGTGKVARGVKKGVKATGHAVHKVVVHQK